MYSYVVTDRGSRRRLCSYVRTDRGSLRPPAPVRSSVQAQARCALTSGATPRLIAPTSPPEGPVPSRFARIPLWPRVQLRHGFSFARGSASLPPLARGSASPGAPLRGDFCSAAFSARGVSAPQGSAPPGFRFGRDRFGGGLASTRVSIAWGDDQAPTGLLGVTCAQLSGGSPRK